MSAKQTQKLLDERIKQLQLELWESKNKHLANGANVGKGTKGNQKGSTKGAGKGATDAGAKGGKGKGTSSSTTPLTCSCCKKVGHKFADCHFKHEECVTCGKYGHRQDCWQLLPASSGGGNAAGGGPKQPHQKTAKQQQQAKQQAAAAAAAPVVCNCCGKAGHIKPDCSKKSEACSICGKIGHLKAMCRHRDKTAGPKADD